MWWEYVDREYLGDLIREGKHEEANQIMEQAKEYEARQIEGEYVIER